MIESFYFKMNMYNILYMIIKYYIYNYYYNIQKDVGDFWTFE